jgi:hypothetical protein
LLAGMARKEHPDYVQYGKCATRRKPSATKAKWPTARVTPHSPDLGIDPAMRISA